MSDLPANTHGAVALREEITRSARARAGLLALVLLATALPIAAFIIGPRLAIGNMDPDLLVRFAAATPAVLVTILVLALTELLAFLFLGRCLRKGMEGPSWLVWVQTALEVFLPTIILASALRVLGMIDTFGGILPWLFFPIITLTALHLRFGVSLFAGLAAAFGFLLVAEVGLYSLGDPGVQNTLTLHHPYYLKAALLAITGLLTGLVALGLRRQLFAAVEHAAERDRAVSIFGQHVSPQVAQRLLHQPIPHTGETRLVCVMFLDIRNFSVFAASHSAEEVMAYLNMLFGPLIEIVNRHHGVVNKFLGDGFMAVFGAPTDDEQPALNAVECALALLTATDQLVAEDRIPSTRLGIGLHLGESVTGNVGAEARKEYTVIGDTVNIAARIEQATKTFNAQLLVSNQIWRALPADRFSATNLGAIELKGQPNGIVLHKLC